MGEFEFGFSLRLINSHHLTLASTFLGQEQEDAVEKRISKTPHSRTGRDGNEGRGGGAGVVANNWNGE